MRLIPILASVFLVHASPATAGKAADVLTGALYTGTLEDGAKSLAALSGEGDAIAEQKAAEGLLAFTSAIERLGQSLYRHGLETHPGGVLMQLPILRMPVEPNPNPEPITYDKWRIVLQTLFDDLAKADALLAAGADADKTDTLKLAIDLKQVRLDLNGDGKAADTESFAAILQKLAGSPEAVGEPDLNFAYDKADLLWLRGYIQFLSAFTEFALAVDFEDAFNKTGHAWFPRAGLPYADELLAPAMAGGFVDNSVGDALAFIHLLNWKVTDADKLKNVRERLVAMAALSRDSWAAARAEADDDREWLPNAKQSGRWGMAVDDVTIDGWLGVMAEFEQVLEGRKLMPHWRFEKGLNIKRFFDESKQIDAVLLVAGVDALPFLEQGSVSSAAEWDRLMSVFRGNFLGYALWFN